MKGNNLVNGMIAIMIGAVLIFAVIVPIMNNAVLGTLFDNEAKTNTSSIVASVQNITTTCTPIRSDTTYLVVLNSTSDDITSAITVDDATLGGLFYTNTTVIDEPVSMSYTVDYRCTGDSAYIDASLPRTIANIIVPIIIVFLIVGLTAFIV